MDLDDLQRKYPGWNIRPVEVWDGKRVEAVRPGLPRGLCAVIGTETEVADVLREAKRKETVA